MPADLILCNITACALFWLLLFTFCGFNTCSSIKSLRNPSVLCCIKPNACCIKHFCSVSKSASFGTSNRKGSTDWNQTFIKEVYILEVETVIKN